MKSAAEFQMLRARIEAELSTPAALIVSSAQAGDGKTLCARGLAETMSTAAYKTLYVDVNHNAPELSGLPQPATLSSLADSNLDRFVTVDRWTALDLLSIASDTIATSASGRAVSQVMKLLRQRYEMIVIDAGCLIQSNLAVLFAAAANAVVLAIREGRPVHEADGATLDLLRECHANFFGIVAATPGAIDSSRNDRRALLSIAPTPVPGAKEARSTF